MKRAIVVAAVFAGALAAGNVLHAEWFGWSWWPSIVLTDQDRDIIRTTLQRQIHGRPVGAAASWQNAATGHSGSVRLLGTATRQRLPCDRIEYRIASSQPGESPEHYVFHTCWLPDGTLRLGD